MYPNHSEQLKCASSSSPSSARTVSQGYDVFLSFRGEDTRNGFISHLYQALTRNHITTYKDDKTLDIGSFIAPELLGAIEASRFAIVVLSGNFATSKWCLEEIVKVVDCLEQGKLIVIPVFYDVSPSDVRHQSGCFKQGFANHKANPEITPQKLETWRSAFSKVGGISGLHITEHRNEAECIDEIVRRVLKDHPLDTLSIDLNGLVGMESRADEVKRILKMDCSKLEYIPRFGQNMKRLQHLYVDGTSITELPDNLGEMHDLRNINASGTSIEELQSCFHHLRKLRILHVHRCPLLSKTGGFLNTNLGTLSSGLREFDLSYCNLSMVPDGIGSLYCLITLDLSGNDFDSLPASIGLLSKLRMLSLNNCKMLQSLPKLSLLDEDPDYGPRSRFNFCVSKEGIDVSKYHASSNNTGPTVSCLNCPKLAENASGSSLTDKILNSYLQIVNYG